MSPPQCHTQTHVHVHYYDVHLQHVHVYAQQKVVISYPSPVLYAAYHNHIVTHGGDVRIPSAGLLSSSADIYQSEPRTGIN